MYREENKILPRFRHYPKSYFMQYSADTPVGFLQQEASNYLRTLQGCLGMKISCQVIGSSWPTLGASLVGAGSDPTSVRPAVSNHEDRLAAYRSAHLSPQSANIVAQPHLSMSSLLVGAPSETMVSHSSPISQSDDNWHSEKARLHALETSMEQMRIGFSRIESLLTTFSGLATLNVTDSSPSLQSSPNRALLENHSSDVES